MNRGRPAAVTECEDHRMESPRRARHPIFARCYSVLGPLAELAAMQGVRRELLGGLSGRVLEIGGGAGANLRHYPQEVEKVTVAEPEAALRSACRRAARSASAAVEVIDAIAEALPLPDASCDAAVSALVLCSVTDQQQALAELMRVIRAHGELRFYEHVRSPGLGGRVQDAVDPAWGVIAGGCHLNRATLPAISQAGFIVTAMREVPTRFAGIPLPAPRMVLGRAIRP